MARRAHKCLGAGHLICTLLTTHEGPMQAQDSTFSPPKLMTGWANVVKAHPPGASPRAGMMSPQASPKARNGSVSGGSPRVSASTAADKDQQSSLPSGVDRAGDWGQRPATSVPATSWGQRSAPSTPVRAPAAASSATSRSVEKPQAVAPAPAALAAEKGSPPHGAASEQAAPQAVAVESPPDGAGAAAEKPVQPQKPVTPEKPAWGRVSVLHVIL